MSDEHEAWHAIHVTTSKNPDEPIVIFGPLYSDYAKRWGEVNYPNRFEIRPCSGPQELYKVISGLRDAILEGEKRWTEAEKSILKIMENKNIEYYVLHCKAEHAADKLNNLVKQRWEVKHANCSESEYCATLIRRKL